MKIKSISLSNFKYVTKNKEMKIDLSDGESLIMGGPNGYGKTTVFDAVELLVTGRINHFNAELLNRGKETIAILANDNTSDIKVKAEFIKNKSIVFVERTFIANENYDSKLSLNGNLINDASLFSELGISRNFFDLGMYISQIDSLNFLQQKYKTRKDSITGVLDNTQIEIKLNELKQIELKLKEKYQTRKKNSDEELLILEKKKKKLEEKLELFKLSEENISYQRLFTNKEYSFDREFFDVKDEFEVVISELNYLMEYTKKYEGFLVKKRNKKNKAIISIDKKIYTALFFKSEIDECKRGKEIIALSNEIVKMKESVKQKKFNLQESIIHLANLNSSVVEHIHELVSSKNTIEQGMTATQSSLSKLLKQREAFINIYVDWDGSLKNICPLCGRESAELEKLFLETEAVLKGNLGLIAARLSEIINKLTEIFDLEIFVKTDKFVTDNHLLIERNNLLLPFLHLTTLELEEKLNKEKIVFTNTMESIDLSVFDKKYLDLIVQLNSHIIEENVVISDEMYINLCRVETEYYQGSKPYDSQTLMRKNFYISSLFSNSLSKEKTEVENEYLLLKESLEIKNTRFDDMCGNLAIIIQKYESAKKNYQSNIAKNIAVPLFIFSGKIIQNYPLGLGVVIRVDKNSIVFGTKNIESDIFNNLSTGQLNGVVISLLLSIKEIFSAKDSLNTLLIDDPLQTIDEISAISLVDLLSDHFGNTQVFLSTHEDDKQFLIKKKYEQSGHRCKVLNMQDEFLK